MKLCENNKEYLFELCEADATAWTQGKIDGIKVGAKNEREAFLYWLEGLYKTGIKNMDYVPAEIINKIKELEEKQVDNE